MAQVFLSYDREDGAKARVIAQALERAGHFVWWDLHIKGGAEYGKVIEQALADADAVVVLWSTKSVDSAWVRDEAAAGRDSGRLIPVLLEPVNPPMGFRQYQNLDFTTWKGRGKPPRMAEFLASIEVQGGIPLAVPRETAPMAARSHPPRTLSKWALISGAVLLALVALGLFVGLVLNDRRKSTEVQTVAVVAADAGAKMLARDLLVNLGRLQSAKLGSLQLVNTADTPDRTSDLIFELASANGSRSAADLVLMTGSDRSILWSKDFRPETRTTDLKQQLAFTAARVLGCALDGLSYDGRKLDPQTFKIYLNACADLAERYRSGAQTLVPLFKQVAEAAPGFEPGWAKLLLVQAEAVDAERGLGPNPAAERELRRGIKDARKLHPHLAEINIAEISLVPEHAYARRIRLADEAVMAEPDNVWALTRRSTLLRSVGRIRASIEDAMRAHEIDPLSPATLNAYISALAYGGRIDAAREQLAEAERLWPGTASLEDIRFRFHLRYGDPKIAFEIARAGGAEPPMMMFIEARTNPTKANIDRYIAYTAHVQQNVPRAIRLAFILQGWGEFNRVDELYREMLPWPTPSELAGLTEVIFRPALKTLRQDPRFMQFSLHSGLLDYWRTSGKWPDFCFEPDQPYDCKAEAAKLR
jgi:tetratricopeptide (TPR) repeat protein